MFRDTQLHQSKYINSPQTDVQVNTIPSKITGGFFVCEYRQDYSKVYMERQSRIAKTILKMKNKVGGIHLLRDKSYYTVIKTMWYW